MHALWTILACFSGVFAIAFLLAGILGLQSESTSESEEHGFLLALDVIGLSALVWLACGVMENWSSRKDERRLVYAGLVCLLALGVFGCLTKYSA